MRIAQVLLLRPQPVDGFRCVLVVAAAGVEVGRDLREYVRGNLVAALAVQLRHELGYHPVVKVRREEQQSLEVGRDQDIHRGGGRGIEIAVAVVLAVLLEEVGQHVVAVGRADELVHRQAHLLCDVSGEDVAEVAGRDADIDPVALADRAGLDHVAVCGDIVRDLRRETAPVDGVRRGQHHAVPVELRTGLVVGEDALYCALCVVEVAVDGDNLDVRALLRRHLELLHRGNAVYRIVDHDLGARDIVEAVERCLAGVARGRHEDARGARLAGLAQGRGQQMRQHLERHILECTGRAVPQLEQVLALGELHDRSGVRAAELLVSVSLRCEVRELLCREIGQELAEDERRATLVVALRKRFPVCLGECRERGRAVETAVRRDAVGDGISRGNLAFSVSCAYIIHLS